MEHFILCKISYHCAFRVDRKYPDPFAILSACIKLMGTRTIYLLKVSKKGEQICNGGSRIEEEVMGHEDWHCIHTTFRKSPVV